MPINIDLWKRYAVTLSIRNKVTGGIPTNPDLIKGWLQANMPLVAEEEKAKLAEKTLAELPAAVEDKAEAMWNTFKEDADGIYFEGRNVKSMFKECANILREKLIASEKAGKAPDAKEKKSRFTNLKSRLAERLFVEDDKIRFVRDGKPLLEVDGDEERAIHVMTAQGPRTALKRCDFVNGPVELSFTIRVMDDGVVDEDLVRVLLDFAGWNGLGAERSQGSGLFEVSSLKAI